MKTCPNCGTVLADEVVFCTSCGAAALTAEAAVQPAAPAPVSYAPPAEPPKAPMSVGGWMARDLIAFIPLVGGILYFIMLWVWAADQSREESFRNWAKSRLIWIAVGAGIGLLMVILLLGLGFGLADVIAEFGM